MVDHTFLYTGAVQKMKELVESRTIGNPLYFTQIANEGAILGMVSVAGRQRPVMAVDAPVFKGNSGSPVINEQGQAIGVIYATGEIVRAGKTEQVGLAVPLSDMAHLLKGWHEL